MGHWTPTGVEPKDYDDDGDGDDDERQISARNYVIVRFRAGLLEFNSFISLHVLLKFVLLSDIAWSLFLLCRGGVGKEVISRFSSNLSNNKTFYTDSNGREILKRV